MLKNFLTASLGWGTWWYMTRSELRWIHPKEQTTAAWATSSASWEDRVDINGACLPLRFWSVPRWSYDHRASSLILGAVPLAALIPGLHFCLDDVLMPGLTLLMPGVSHWPTLARASFGPSLVFYFNIDRAGGPDLLQLYMTLPQVVQRHREDIRAVGSAA